jgi:AcrR family transcriptional regulator
MPRLVDRTERQQELTHAALAVFAERGYHGATMQAVADRAGVSKGSVYDYFNSKEELLIGAAELIVGALMDQSVMAFERSEGNIRERVEHLVGSILAGIDDWAEVCLSLLQVWAELGAAGDRPLRDLMSDLYRRSADRLQAVLDAAVAAGEADPFPTRAAALAVMAAIDGTVLQATMVPEEFHRVLESGVLPRWCAQIVPIHGERT